MVESGFSHGLSLVSVPEEQAVSLRGQFARRHRSRPEQRNKPITEKGARCVQVFPVLHRHQTTILTHPYQRLIGHVSYFSLNP